MLSVNALAQQRGMFCIRKVKTQITRFSGQLAIVFSKIRHLTNEVSSISVLKGEILKLTDQAWIKFMLMIRLKSSDSNSLYIGVQPSISQKLNIIRTSLYSFQMQIQCPGVLQYLRYLLCALKRISFCQRTLL